MTSLLVRSEMTINSKDLHDALCLLLGYLEKTYPDENDSMFIVRALATTHFLRKFMQEAWADSEVELFSGMEEMLALMEKCAAEAFRERNQSEGVH